MEKQKITFREVCAWFFVFVSAFFAILTLEHGAVTLFCMYMMDVDKGPVDHNWNCGVLLHGLAFIFWMVSTSVCLALAYPVIKNSWWEVFMRRIRTAILSSLPEVDCLFGILRLEDLLRMILS